MTGRPERDPLLVLAEVYGSVTGLRPRGLARTIGTRGIFGRLNSGMPVASVDAERALHWFSRHWPPDLPWPAVIPRPPPGERFTPKPGLDAYKTYSSRSG